MPHPDPPRPYETLLDELLENDDTGLGITIRTDFPVDNAAPGTLGYEGIFKTSSLSGYRRWTIRVYFTWNSADEIERHERFEQLFRFLYANELLDITGRIDAASFALLAMSGPFDRTKMGPHCSIEIDCKELRGQAE